MEDYVLVQVRSDVGAKLDQLGILAGSPSAAIERLIEHWQRTNPLAVASAGKAPVVPSGAVWITQNGDSLPVGAPLEGWYRRKAYFAVVEPKGIRYGSTVYPSPTAAARAVKTALGVTGSAASTDGRDFWKLRDSSTGRLVSIKDLAPRAPIDTQKILDELRAKGRP